MPRPAMTNSRTDDTLGSGVESGLMLVVFAGVGLVIDRWLGTVPWFTIGLLFLGAVGVFYRLKSRYDVQMDAHHATRTAQRSPREFD